MKGDDATLKTVTVLCENDFPHSVWESDEAAQRERTRLNAADRRAEAALRAQGQPHYRMHYHTRQVPFYGTAVALMFPIMDGPDVPWAVMAIFEKQVKKNHGQSLERLAHRGGLGVQEALWVMTCKPYGDESFGAAWTQPQRIERLRMLVARLQAPIVVDSLGPDMAQAPAVKQDGSEATLGG